MRQSFPSFISDISETSSNNIGSRYRTAVRPLNIAVLGYRSAPYGGGQGIYIKYLSKALVDMGHTVDVISGEPYPHLDKPVRLIKLPGLNLYENGLDSLRLHHLRSITNIIEWTSKLTGGFAEPYCFGRRVLKYLHQHGRHYDIVHDNQCLAWGMLQLQQQGFPLVTTIHHPISSDLSIELSAAKNWRERLLIKRWHAFLTMQRKVAARLNHIITVSQRSRDDIKSAFAIADERITVIYNGIDTETFKPDPAVNKIPRRIMATASADAPLKGVQYLLEALSLLTQHFSDIELLMVGKPKPGGKTEQRIEQLNLASHIQWVSGISTDALVKYYNEAEVVIVPSVYEGFGLPAGEAMACGVPVVSTDGGALPEVVGGAGVQVPVKDSQALADAVAALLEDQPRRDLLSRLSRNRILERFSWQQAAAEMTDYYYRVIGEDSSTDAIAQKRQEAVNANG